MALIDKVKAQAQDVAKRAQEAGRAGQAKIDEIQQKRALDTRYRDLGEAYYAEQAGTGGHDAVDQAVAAVRAQLESTADTD